MTREDPSVARYMARFESALRHYELPDPAGIAADLRSHIAEALSYGKPVDEVLEGLGRADVLARAYAVELTINPRLRRGRIAGILQVTAMIAASSLVSLIVVGTLGSIGVGFTLSGLTTIVIALLEGIGVHLPHVQTADIPPLAIGVMGLAIALVGLGASWLLWLYVRALVRTLGRAIPRALAPRPA